MIGKRQSTIISVMYLTLVGVMCFMLFYLRNSDEGGYTYMTQGMTDIGALAAAITFFVGIVTVVVSQILFYKKDSQTMSEIKQDVTTGHERLNDRLDDKERHIQAQHMLRKNEHDDIRDIVREIQLKQDMELKLHEKVLDTVPDAGMIKDGIDKICQDNIKLREEVKDLKHQIEKL